MPRGGDGPILAIWNWVIVAAIVFLVFFGPKRLPFLGRAVGETVRNFKHGLREGPAVNRRRSAPAPGSGTDPVRGRTEWVRVLLGSPGRRRATLVVLVVLLVSYVAYELTEGLLGGAGLRLKAIVFFILLLVGCGLFAGVWLSRKARARPQGRPER